eukprot:4552393-Prymnesium_polylepis.1
MTSHAGSMAVNQLIDVPYRPFGIFSTPTKHTWFAPCFGLLTPALISTSRSSTPFHTDVLTPAAPQSAAACGRRAAVSAVGGRSTSDREGESTEASPGLKSGSQAH